MSLIVGDALEVMRSMEDESFDAVVTDPPFGIGFLYENAKEMHDNPEAYGEWIVGVYGEMMRLLKPGGFIAVWQTQLYFPHFWEWFGRDIHIYCAAKNFVQIRQTPINYAYDPVVMRYKPGGKPLRPEKPPRSIDYYVGNTAKFVSATQAPERGHPCPRPLDQVREIVRNFTLPGGRVFDPFAGSGTTGVACVLEGREWVMVEKEEAYAAIADQRLRLAAPIPGMALEGMLF